MVARYCSSVVHKCRFNGICDGWRINQHILNKHCKPGYSGSVFKHVSIGELRRWAVAAVECGRQKERDRSWVFEVTLPEIIGHIVYRSGMWHESGTLWVVVRFQQIIIAYPIIDPVEVGIFPFFLFYVGVICSQRVLSAILWHLGHFLYMSVNFKMLALVPST